MKQTPLKRGPGPIRHRRLARAGRRAKREAEALAAFRTTVLARARGLCERCGSRGRLEAHHLRTNPRVHRAEFGAGLCRTCHRAIHTHTVSDWPGWFDAGGPRV